MVRWWWFGPAVSKPELLRELQQMQHDGIGGAELAFVYPESVTGNVPFLSPPMLDAVHYAQREGRRLGLRIDLTLCSGWPYGGPATPLSQAASRLRVAEVAVPPGSTTVTPPGLAEGEALVSTALVTGQPTPVPRHGQAPAPTWDPATASAAFLPGSHLETATISPSQEPRVALFFISSHTRQQVKRAALGAEGYVLDPFSAAAVATHLRSVGEPLVQAFGSTPPYAIFSDSLEAYGADWTPDLLAEFSKRRGYSLLPHLPELVAGGSPAAETVRHDYGRTLTELVNENYLTQIDAWAHAHNTRFRSQTYGDPAVSLASQRLVDLPEGEGPQWRQFSTLRWATSANHLYGNPVTSGETYTWLHSPVFRATPLDMKLEADIDFLTGENQFIFHGWPYSPPSPEDQPAGYNGPVLQRGDPGWSLYAAGAFNDHNPWHPVMPAVTAYLTRVSWLLRQGKPSNQVAVLLPTDDAWASFSPGHTSVTAEMSRRITPELVGAILSAGYNLDFTDADTIDREGVGPYPIVVIPPTTRIPAATLGRLAAFQRAGGKVLVVGQRPTLDAEGRALPPAARSLGIVVAEPAALPEALHRSAVPDLLFSVDGPDRPLDPATGKGPLEGAREQVGFIHRALPEADIFFVANTGNTPVGVQATFRTRFPHGAIFDPTLAPGADGQGGSVAPHQMPLQLGPYESRVLIFSAGPARPNGGVMGGVLQSVDLSRGWQVQFPGLGKTVSEPTRTDWTADPATLHYSGEAIYSRDFSLAHPTRNTWIDVGGGEPLPEPPRARTPPHDPMLNGMPNPLVTGTGPGIHAYYDPPLHEAALVVVNGTPAGALWHPPYRLAVGQLLKPGENHIEIHVFNTALNAWSALPPRDYGPLKAKYGDRFQMQDLDQVRPIPSGLLGPIHLVQGPVQ